MTNNLNKKCGTVALVGLPNAGKSTLLNKLIGQKIAPVTYKPNTTRKILNGVLTRKNTQIIFVDTPGMTEKGRLPDADILVWLADATKEISRPPVKLNENIVLVLNKIDVFKDKKALLPIIKQWQELIKPKEILCLSAKTGNGLEEFVNHLSSKLPEKDFIFDPDSMTDSSERELVAELIREKALLCLDKEVPYNLEVKIENFDESRREDKKKSLVDISVQIEVAKDSHKPIVIGKGGQSIKKIGQMARKELEYLLGCQVMLRLFVRVKR